MWSGRLSPAQGHGVGQQFVVGAIVPVRSAQRIQDLFGGAGPQPRLEALRIDEPLPGARWPVSREQSLADHAKSGSDLH